MKRKGACWGGRGGAGEAGGVSAIRVSGVWMARWGASFGCEVCLSQSLALSVKVPGQILNGVQPGVCCGGAL